MTKLEIIEKKIRKISPRHYNELDKLIEDLLKKSRKTKKRKMKLNLRGALKDIKYSSVELQHKVKKWIAEDTPLSKNN
jgi:hypothetical protein